MDDAIAKMIEVGFLRKKEDEGKRAAALEEEHRINLESWAYMIDCVGKALPEPLRPYLKALRASENRLACCVERFELEIEGLAPIQVTAQIYGNTTEITGIYLPTLVCTLEDGKPYFSFRYEQRSDSPIEYYLAQAKSLHDDYILAYSEWLLGHDEGDEVLVEPVYEEVDGGSELINIDALATFVRKIARESAE